MAAGVTPDATGAKVSFGIGAQMALLVCLTVGLATVAGALWSSSRLSDELIREEYHRQRLAAEAAGVSFTSGIESLRQDTGLIAGVPSVTVFVRASEGRGTDPVPVGTEQYWRQLATQAFKAALYSKPQYFLLRLIGAAGGGREIVRVERRGDEANVVPEEALQKNGQRPYFQEASQQPTGVVYLSDIELTEEHAPAPEARIPTLRAATAIHHANGELFGIFVINQDLRPRFARMQQILAGRYDLYLFNQQGQVLLHPDPSPPSEVQAGKPWRASDEFPGLSAHLDSSNGAQWVVDHPASGEKLVATLLRLHWDPDRPDRYCSVLLTSNYSAVIAHSIEQRNQTLLFGGLMMAATLSTVLLVSRSLTRPLRQITNAVLAFGRGETAAKLPLESRDEAGVLARTFDEMFRRVNQHGTAMEEEIAERRRTEATLREIQQRLQIALDAARAGVWEWDLVTDKTTWDDTTETLLDVDLKTFPGTGYGWTTLMHPDDAGTIREAQRLTRTEGRTYDCEYRIRGRRGVWLHRHARGITVFDPDGKPSKVIGVSWDTTEAKLTEQRIRDYAAELERKNREMEQFVYSVSHDLKSPLVTCKGFVGILKEDLAEGKIEDALDSAKRLDRATQHMGRLIEDLLQLSRVGRVTNRPEPVEISNLVRELAEQFSAQLEARGAVLRVEPDMPTLMVDPLAVSRLFENLLGNALKYGCDGPEPRIEVGCRVLGGEVRFFVSDNGPGIPAEYHKKIFGLFQRLDTAHEGTGIGLAVVSKLMEVHAGRTWVESETNQGATFWVAFPAHFLTAATPAPTGSFA